jgi:general nucleoside transport system permease protein
MTGWRIEPRLRTPPWVRWVHTISSVVAALLVGALFLAIAGVSPGAAYVHIVQTGLLGGYAISDTIVRATPILLCALGTSVAFRMKLWNIGGEGQLYLGAWAAAAVALHILPPSTPAWLMIPAMMAAGAAAGAAWSALAGLLRAHLQVNEIITTLMLNYIASLWIAYFVFGPWSERGFPLTPSFPDSANLPRLADFADRWPVFSGWTAHAGALIAIGATVATWWLIARTRWGFEVRVLGENAKVARLAGMNLARTTILVMAVSGALCGLAGMCEVSGVVHRLQDRFSPGYGFTGIIVAWLGKLEPWRMVVVAFLFGALLVGGKEIQPGGVPQMLQGIILFVIVGAEFLLRYRIRLVARSETTP